MSFADPAGSPWLTPGARATASHGYPLAVRDATLGAAIGLMMRSLPYALVRFGVLMAASLVTLIWLVVMLGGGAWLANHIAGIFGLVWIVGWALCASFIWGTAVRYILHLIECGHVAVLTELITRGQIANGDGSMFAHGRRLVTERFAQINVLFGLHALIRGIVQSVHRTMDMTAEMLPVRGLETIANLADRVLKAATRYIDKVIFSYNLARNSTDPWITSREGLVYYAQNAQPVLKTAIWCVVLEWVLTVLLWIVLLIPAAVLTLMLPHALRESGGLATVLVALLLVGPIRAAFVRPIFLIMMMVRFHACAEGQPINPQWDAQLASISDQFRTLGVNAAASMGRSRWGSGLV
jgi:hypothetical protein